MPDSSPERTTFLTVAEVAEMLRVSRMTVYRWVHSGDLPAVRFGRSFRVPQQAVEVFMQEAMLNGGIPAEIEDEDDGRSTGAVG